METNDNDFNKDLPLKPAPRVRRPSEEKNVLPSRLDLKTRICFMAAFIYASEEMSVDQAINRAIDIEDAADAAVKRMKRENPVPRFKVDR